MRILPQLPYALLRRSPRALVGFSDITALLAACCRHAGIVCFHVPTVSMLPTSDEESLASFWHALTADEPVTVQDPESICLRPGKAAGPVLGGNLNILSHLVGTRFFPTLKGALLFIEDRNEAPYRIDRMLTHLIQAGVLAEIARIMVGTFSDCGSPGDLLDLFRERLAPFSVPILGGFPAGHGSRNITLPLGLTAIPADDCKHQRWLRLAVLGLRSKLAERDVFWADRFHRMDALARNMAAELGPLKARVTSRVDLRQ